MSLANGEAGFVNSALILEALELEPEFSVGDLGCGSSGHFSIHCARALEKGKVYSVDVQKGVLKHLKSICLSSGIDNVLPVWSDLEIYGATKIPEHSLDRVLLINILFQTSKTVEVFKEALRLLKVGGRLLIVDWKKGNEQLGPPLEVRLSREKLVSLANQFNMDLEKEFEAGPYHYGMLFLKRF